MTDFYIFRHGNTVRTDNIFLKFFGHTSDSSKLEILPKAKYALEKIGGFLKDVKTDINFSSPYLRCLQSVEIVTKVSGKKFRIDERLHEFERDGETTKSLEERVRSFLEDVKKKNYSSVSICTHGAVIGAIKHLVTENKFQTFDIFNYPDPGNLIVIKDKKIEEIDFNLKK